jgi:cytidine deaminase
MRKAQNDITHACIYEQIFIKYTDMPDRDISKELQQTMSRLPLVDSPAFNPAMRDVDERKRAILSLTPGNLLFAMQKSREAFGYAISWRNFNVGAAVVGINPQYQFLTGVNVKPDEESSVNIHAEQLALQKARDRGFSAVRMIVVIGNVQADTQSGHEMHTLHPCGLCRQVIEEDPMIDNDVTLIASTTLDFRTLELYNLKSLKAFHESGSEEGIERFLFPDMPNLFAPVPQLQRGGAYDLAAHDTSELRAEEDIWDENVGLFLARRRQQLLAEL